jgi:purine-binding chemotaxis protein CheW
MSARPEAAQEEHVVVFSLGGEHYGVEVTDVQEIIPAGNVVPLPNAPDSVEGLTNLRGRIVPAVNLRRRLGMEAVEATSEARVVVVSVDGVQLGLVVDAVSEVMRIPQSLIDPPSALATLPDDDLVRGIGKLDRGLVCLLNLRPLVGGL